jgi:hypothetical protein
MRQLIVLVSLCALTNASFARSPIANWQAVQDVPPGSQIMVAAGHDYPCLFVRATEDELICGGVQRGWMVSEPQEIHFRRDQIREVRIDRGDAANSLAGAGIGASVGAAVGAAGTTNARGSAALLFGIFGSAFGARLGQAIHVLRGKVIYRSASVKNTKRDNAPATADAYHAPELTARISP